MECQIVPDRLATVEILRTGIEAEVTMILSHQGPNNEQTYATICCTTSITILVEMERPVVVTKSKCGLTTIERKLTAKLTQRILLT